MRSSWARLTRGLLGAAAGMAAAAALALLPAAAADAHDYLVGSDPAAGSTVAAPPSTVTLTFNDRVLDLSGSGSTNLLTVTGPDAATRHYETGCATVAGAQLSAPVALGAAGRYTVTYQIVSGDGHTVSSSYAFTYQPPAGATAAAGAETSPCGAGGSTGTQPTQVVAASAAPTGAPATASTPKPTTQPSNGMDLGLVIGIAAGIVVLAVAGVLIVVLTSRRKPAGGVERAPSHEPDDDDRGE